MCACVCCREPAVEQFRHVYRVHTLCVCVCIFYTLRSSLSTVGCMFAACSREERSRQRFRWPMRFTARTEAEAHRRNSVYRLYFRNTRKYIASYVNTTQESI